MDEMRFLSSYFGVLVHLFVVPVLLRVRGAYRRLFRGQGHHREHHASEVFQRIRYRSSSGDIGACVVQVRGGGSERGGAYK